MKRLFLIMLAVSSAALVAMPGQGEDSSNCELHCLFDKTGKRLATGATVAGLTRLAENQLGLHNQPDKKEYSITCCSQDTSRGRAGSSSMNFCLYHNGASDQICAVCSDKDLLSKVQKQESITRPAMVCMPHAMQKAESLMLSLCDANGELLLMSPDAAVLARTANAKGLSEYHITKGTSCARVCQKIQAARQSAAAH